MNFSPAAQLPLGRSPAKGRSKQPTQVRQRLLAAAERLITENGLSHFTLEAVAKEAGVSKGGLLHHYPSKQALVDNMFAGLLERLGQEIAAQAAADEHSQGRFTRAYLKVSLTPDDTVDNRLMGVFIMATGRDQNLKKRWLAWIGQQTEQYGEPLQHPELWIVRHAADGMWITDLTVGPLYDQEMKQNIAEQLLRLTY